MKNKPKNYWTKEKCQEESLKYQNRNDFQNNCGGAYNSALKNKWLNDICLHMEFIRKPKNYWTKEKCQEESLKYQTKEEFKKYSSAAYIAMKRHHWINDVCSHMIICRIPSTYWTKERCQEESLKYNSRREFERKSSGAYKISKINGWYNEICSHMIQFRNKYSGYAFEFSDNTVYIGITSRSKRRYKTHLTKKESTVFKHIKLTKLTPKKIDLFKPTTPEKAAKLEGEWVLKYINSGWNILNIKNTGSLGGIMVKWTFEKCQKESLNYMTRGEFKKNSLAYSPAYKNGWIDKICSHMIKPPRYVYWTYDRCKEESLKYKIRNELRNSSRGAYKSASKNKWLDEFYPKNK